jgi:bifunctional oligoribonuclease and PAP phosphatase NrnA
MISENIQNLLENIKAAKNIVITAHKSPDGDSIGSSLGLFHFLKQFEADVTICHPDKAPPFLEWMPGFESVNDLESQEDKVIDLMSNADLIFCLDYNSSSRIGHLEKYLIKSEAKKVMIDHHRDPDMEFCDIVFSDITSCSTAQLIYEIIIASGYEKRINQEVATALYTGIVTDTGSFRFSSTLPKTHNIVAKLMETGFNHSLVHEQIYDANSLDRIKLTSFAMLEKLEILHDGMISYISLTQNELKRFNAGKGDTEGLVNMALGIQGVRMAVFLKESDGIIKMSFRSKGVIPVSDMASKHFQGGGHLNASGGKFVGNINNAIEKLVTILPNFVKENKALFE